MSLFSKVLGGFGFSAISKAVGKLFGADQGLLRQQSLALKQQRDLLAAERLRVEATERGQRRLREGRGRGLLAFSEDDLKSRFGG